VAENNDFPQSLIYLSIVMLTEKTKSGSCFSREHCAKLGGIQGGSGTGPTGDYKEVIEAEVDTR
jgi:hypothetical protein